MNPRLRELVHNWWSEQDNRVLHATFMEKYPGFGRDVITERAQEAQRGSDRRQRGHRARQQAEAGQESRDPPGRTIDCGYEAGA